jgi:endonuclease-3 related protein
MAEAEIRNTLFDIYHHLLSRYGPQHWWPAEEPFEIIVGAILTQSAAWVNVEKAIAGLRAAGALNPQALRTMPPAEIAGHIRFCGYFNAKARKLRAFAKWFERNYGSSLKALFARDTVELRHQLLAVYGIGEETADSIILYAAGKPIFVIDAYTRRIVSRLGLTVADKTPYSRIQSFFMENLPTDAPLFNEYHALLVRLGKEVCRLRPLCSSCCLKDMCQSCNSICKVSD